MGKPLKELMDGFEKNVLMSALEEHSSQQSIAEALGVDQSTIARKFKKHGIKIPTPSNHTQ
jgi:TyrR family helix-turn-helix protein